MNPIVTRALNKTLHLAALPPVWALNPLLPPRGQPNDGLDMFSEFRMLHIQDLTQFTTLWQGRQSAAFQREWTSELISMGILQSHT